MKSSINKVKLTMGLLATLSLPANAQLDPGYDSFSQMNQSLQTLVQYVYNLGLDFGYNLKTPSQTQSANASLLYPGPMQILQSYAITTLMGASPVNAFNQALSSFVPEENNYSTFNALANLVYNQAQTNETNKIFITPGIDQQTYQQDPVSQSILNILATPDFSFCLTQNENKIEPHCNLLYNNLVSSNAVGELPPPRDFYNYSKYIKDFLPQLNSDTLISPLWYSESAISSEGEQQQQQGLATKNQVTAANNFIDYVSNAVVPIQLADKQQYSALYAKAAGLSKETKLTQQQAINQLATYLASLRVYAAKASVVTGNLYYIFNKRLTQKQGADAGAPQTSQALSEYVMATWRLYNPNTNEKNKQWINKINSASPATVQKEIAVLLAEINYQMYLSRQQEERMLMTNSIMLLQYIKMNVPRLQNASSN